MAKSVFNFHSEVLGFHQTVQILFPDPNIRHLLDEGPKTRELPVLYLLHGLRGGAHTWTAYSSVERYLYESGKEMVIVMPEMGNNFYTDQHLGWPYLRYVGEELPRIVETMMHISSKREDTYVAGLSMGGYGAMKLALTYPEKFGHVFSFSGVLDIQSLFANPPEDPSLFSNFAPFVFGEAEHFAGSANDLFALLEQVDAQGKPKPEIYLSCGSADDLFPASVKMRDAAQARGYAVRFHEERNMGHAWRFWDMEIEKVLRTLITL